MKFKPSFSNHRFIVEPLEQRIAPALLVNGANLLGAGNSTLGQTSSGGTPVTLVKVLSGDAIVWFDHGLIDSISVGPNTSLDIYGNVGTIIGNLTSAGKLSDSDNNPSNGLDGGLLLPNNIVGITTHPLSSELGTVGDIITGGSVSNVNISGNLSGIYAGTGIFRPQAPSAGGNEIAQVVHANVGGTVSVVVQDQYNQLDVNPILPGVQDTFVLAQGTAKVLSGASIANVTIGAAEELQLFAGNGTAGVVASPGHPATPGHPGGSITNITVDTSFIPYKANASIPTYFLLAGDGGNGLVGGAGGSITHINEISSTGVVKIVAGQGGAGANAGGGAGGSISGLNMESISSAYTVQAGAGGTGSPGGAGGSVRGVNFGGDELSNGIVVSGRFTGGPLNDILLVDSLTGTMIIEKNLGNGQGFTPVIQDPYTKLATIAGVGSQPVGAVAVDVNGDGRPDIVVAYKNSEDLGVFTNQGNGIFYTLEYNNGNYAGDAEDSSTVALPYAPTQLAAGNFLGDGKPDLAVLTNNNGLTELVTLEGDGKGGFSIPGANPLATLVALQSAPVSLITGGLQTNGYNELFVGFKSGAIDSLEPTGSTSASPFSVTLIPSAVTGGGVANLDYDVPDNLLLALNGFGTSLSIFSPVNGGGLLPYVSASLSQEPGTALVAHFVPQIQPGESIEVLSSVSGGSRLDVYSASAGFYALTSSTQSSEALRNFVPVIEGGTSGVAAVGGSFEHFAFSESGAAFFDVSLPFSGKAVSVSGGAGGNGIDSLTNVARGGAGGGIFGMSVLAGDVTLDAGVGGSSQNAAAGAGGSVIDTPTLVNILGQSLPTIIEAGNVLSITAGSGGTAGGLGHLGSGGAGGSVEGLSLSLQAGPIDINAGNGGNGGGGAGGAGGMVTALKTVDFGGNLTIAAGNGGSAGAVGNGGAGGSISNLNHTLTLADQTQELPYGVTLTAGAGGSSVSAIGGAGGSIDLVTMTLQPANESVNNPLSVPSTLHANIDSTLRISITAGNGGSGATGGAGGSLRTISSTSVFDQVITIIDTTTGQTESHIEINPVTAQMTAGNGGSGSKAAGGAGGSVTNLTMVGISYFDPDSADPQAGHSPLVITSGNGGNGVTLGGAGGAITNVKSENAQFIYGGTVMIVADTELNGATVTSGHGGNASLGNGGLGGTISGLNIAVQGNGAPDYLSVSNPTISAYTVEVFGGQLAVGAGAGGNGGSAGRGGAGGSIENSVVGCVDAFLNFGLGLQGGAGGNGALGGGAGGTVTGIMLNAPQNPQVNDGFSPYDALSTIILGGAGGAATGASALGGAGGSVSHITENKDVNSSINLLQAGNGGSSPAGTGGLGGSVTNIFSVGLIGQASDDAGNNFGVFQTAVDPSAFANLFPGGVPEGIFAGRGGLGKTGGSNGSVIAINAAQIAAIGAAVNSQGLFAAAARVADVTAEVIGYDVNGNGLYDNVTGTNKTSPAAATPIDGFIFSQTAPVAVVTSNKTLLEAFTFAP